ncbi:GlxA family transcriptional regulator [Pseudomaricurvus sp. HS19]|uniref:GlxA family transcriptional regulator n=1 Tax=Pseudomaricurvus sp. HS19 TaxID=2692626 RepID=UPI00136B08F1|nr:helix-turn-helix domain-containing protein [Pseudomaricurvus sp. HS19]MYM61946.1 helix-turn-helix domain-containing protein [Pseudomaricurvus sp. HS19]
MSRPSVKSVAPVTVQIVAIPETAGSALYGMVDVLSAAGAIWQTLVTGEPPHAHFQVQVISPSTQPFQCGYGIPVTPAFDIDSAPPADVVIVPEIWLGPEESISGRYPELMRWLQQLYRRGTAIFSACSGSVLLAESGLLNHCEATSHWGYSDLFRHRYPQVRFRPEATLVFADGEGRLVTAGGTTSWHDLALHIISRYAGPGVALEVAKVYLLKTHEEGQLPYTPLIRHIPHNDALVRRCQQWLAEHHTDSDALGKLVTQQDVPERTLKRRFKAATGMSLLEYIQHSRIEEAKRLLETTTLAAEEIGARISYEDGSFFRRLFKRLTGLTPGQYRRMFAGTREDKGLSLSAHK